MKRLLLILSCVLLLGASVNHKIIIGTGGDVLDSVWVFSYIGNVVQDSIKFVGQPIDSEIVIQDTADFNLLARWYFADDSAETVPWRGSSEFIPRPAFIYGAYVLKIYVVDTSANDTLTGVPVVLRNAAGTLFPSRNTNDSGYVAYSVPAGTWTTFAIAPNFTFDTLTTVITASDSTITLQGYAKAAPAAAAGVDYVRAYLDVGEIKIDTLAGTPTPYTKVEFFLDIIGNPKTLSGEWFLLPITYPGKPKSDGRVTFDIPANTKMTPEGTFYRLRYEARAKRGRGRISGEYGNFIVDTLPDPLKIVDAINAYGN